jgi:hypothetical protein
MADKRNEKQQRQQDRVLITALRAAQWELDTVAHDLGADRVTVAGWEDLLEALGYLTDLVRMRSGDSAGPAIERPQA